MLIAHPALRFVIAEPIWEEVLYEVPKRFDLFVAHGRFSREAADEFHAAAMLAAQRRIRRIPPTRYLLYEEEAQVRIGSRDLRDWPTVAVALAIGAAVWTRDKHFLGCGVATWNTETLAAYLAFRERARR